MTAVNWQSLWRQRGVVAILLWPVSCLYAFLAWCDGLRYRIGLKRVVHSPVPVIVVGNITVGGSGKSPLTAWLSQRLQERGLRPGIVSRGYGGSYSGVRRVRATDRAELVGDEPLMLHRMTSVPVCVSRERPAAIAELVRSGDVDVIVADDGLQHHAMARDVEIVVVDAAMRFGNGWRLPAGPLRESPTRLASVDLVVWQHGLGTETEAELPSFELRQTRCRHLVTQACRALGDFAQTRVHAVAGIARPARFFEALKAQHIDVLEHALPDHHPLSVADVSFDDELAVLMTEKDAVKLPASMDERAQVYVVETELVASEALCVEIDKVLEQILMKTTDAGRDRHGH